jgi:hypothetical protein
VLPLVALTGSPADNGTSLPHGAVRCTVVAGAASAPKIPDTHTPWDTQLLRRGPRVDIPGAGPTGDGKILTYVPVGALRLVPRIRRKY